MTPLRKLMIEDMQHLGLSPGQVPTPGVDHLEASSDLVPENAVFLRKILVSQQMLVVGRTCEVGQQTFPIHARKRIRNYPCDQC